MRKSIHSRVFSYLKPSRRLNDSISILLLLVGITFFHWRGVQPGYTFLPVDLANNLIPWNQSIATELQNNLISDPLYQYFPLVNATTSLIISEREWPSWNPYILSGHPMLADPLSQPFYRVLPLLSLWLGTARAFAVGLWGQVCLAAVHPKAYVVYAAETISDDNQAVARLLDDRFAIDSQAITDVPVPLTNRSPVSPTPVRITSYQSDHIEMVATTSETGLLVLRDQYHPGWKATVDGEETQLLRVNHVFRGVMIPPGTHEVVFTFQPNSLSMGLAMSGFGLFLLLVGLALLHKLQAKA